MFKTNISVLNVSTVTDMVNNEDFYVNEIKDKICA